MFGNKLKQRITALEKNNQEQAEILHALDRSMAVIEFDTSKNVITANRNFLDVMGYQLEEIQGQNHRIFVPESEASSSEYQAFWQELLSGKFISHRFQRKHKNGNIIWLEASYNPIVDSAGKVVKVVKFATDITEQVKTENDARAQVAAINRVMAVIEFDLTGQILTANENFLNTVGYRLEEVAGQHHRMFVDPDFATTEAYRDFWKKLASGEYLSGTYKRVGKDGKEIWLEASYNPIIGVDGQPYKVVKYATDIGSNAHTKLLESVIKDASRVLNGFSNGDLTLKMARHLEEDEDSLFRQNIELLDGSLSNMADKLKGVISQALEASQIVNNASSEVSRGALDLSQRIQQQAAALEETSATMNEMSSAVETNTGHAQNASKVAEEVRGQASDGTAVMQQTISAMNSIQESSHKIAEIVTLIDGIAFQTNLLALNAAVEAARAGDHGRGFAVVAGEVRALAQKAAEAARDIKSLIEESVGRVDQGTQLASQSGEMLESISASVEEVAKMISQIAQASEEQTEGINQVHQAISQIDQVTQQNAALVEETTAASESMSEQAGALDRNMRFFNTGSQAQLSASQTEMKALPEKQTVNVRTSSPSQSQMPKLQAPKATGSGEEWGEF